jgi:hypothetical protein
MAGYGSAVIDCPWMSRHHADDDGVAITISVESPSDGVAVVRQRARQRL